jgi:glycosyltransferase involved in cell wall biosynthesis
MNSSTNALQKTSLSPAVPRVKPVILVFTAYYLPGYRGGGPIRSIANMVERLSDDFTFLIVTKDRDLHDQSAYLGVQVDAWNMVGGVRVFYASKSTLSMIGLIRLLRATPHDLVYLNSFFDASFTLLPLLVRRLRLVQNRPTVLAPRGEFSQGALALKRWKKAPFIRIARLTGFLKNIYWHASTVLEAEDIQNSLGIRKSEIRVINNITVAPDLLKDMLNVATENVAQAGEKKALRVCFLSRISPKKNLDFALRVLAQVNTPVLFNIYGPQESADYWDSCQKLIDQLPAHIAVVYGGSIENGRVRATIADNDVFFLPTRGENFGHVFLEAWSAGVPVLISDQTPWLGLAERRLGWDFSLDRPQDFVRTLELAASLNEEERAALQKNCFDFAREKASNPEAVDLNRRLFLDVLARS